MHAYSITQSSPTLCDLMDFMGDLMYIFIFISDLPDGICVFRDRTPISCMFCIGKQFLHH